MTAVLENSTDATAATGAPRRVQWYDGAALLILLLGLILVTEGWFSADEVVMRQQSQELIDGSWAVDPDPAIERLDPDRSFALLARSDRIEGEVAPYTKHPISPLVFAAGRRVAGDPGLLLPGALALITTSLLFARRFRWSPIAFWLPVLATTSLFHLTVVWAHLPALVLATVACLAAFSKEQSGRRVVIASLAVGAVALLRSEGLLLAGAISIGLAVGAGPGLRSRAQSILPVLSGLAVYIIEPVARSAAFDTTAGPLTAPVADSAAPSFIAGRLEILQIMLIEPSIQSGLGQARILGLMLLIAGSVALRIERLRPSSSTVLFAGAAGLYVVSVFSSPIPGLLVAMPVIAAALPWISLSTRSDQAVALAALAFLGAVVLTSYDNAGGGDWGARYLFIGTPLLLLLVVPAVVRIGRTDGALPLIVGALVCGLAVQAGIVHDLLGRGSTVETVDTVREIVEDELAVESSAVVAVSDERLSRFLYDRGLRGRSFHVPDGAESDFFQLMDPERVIWVDLGELSAERRGSVVNSVGSVVIRTEVRR